MCSNSTNVNETWKAVFYKAFQVSHVIEVAPWLLLNWGINMRLFIRNYDDNFEFKQGVDIDINLKVSTYLISSTQN